VLTDPRPVLTRIAPSFSLAGLHCANLISLRQ